MGEIIALPNMVPCCQIIMPISGFAAMTVFFQQQLELMIQKNEISKQIVDQMKSIAAQDAANQAAAEQTSKPQQGQPNAS
jgi:hypothetical protein